MSNADDDDGTTTYQTRFGQEVDRREAHLAGLTGKVYHEWFESLNRASKVFSGNTDELAKHLTKFVGTPLFVSELPDDFGDETARLLHSYLAALATLRDAQRVIHHKLWPDRDDNDPKRTKWEVEVWDPKREELFGDDPTVFLVDLRNYSLHYAIPLVTMATTFQSSGGPGGPMGLNNTVAVHRTELLKWDGWKAAGRRYITSHDGDNIELFPLVAMYSTRVRAFYGWFWNQVEDAVRLSVNEYRYKSAEYGYWLKVETTVSQFGPEGRGVLRRRLAEARLERTAFGTSGWRLIAADENGEWVVGGTDWSPLPPGPR